MTEYEKIIPEAPGPRIKCEVVSSRIDWRDNDGYHFRRRGSKLLVTPTFLKIRRPFLKPVEGEKVPDVPEGARQTSTPIKGNPNALAGLDPVPHETTQMQQSEVTARSSVGVELHGAALNPATGHLVTLEVYGKLDDTAGYEILEGPILDAAIEKLRSEGAADTVIPKRDSRSPLGAYARSRRQLAESA